MWPKFLSYNLSMKHFVGLISIYVCAEDFHETINFDELGMHDRNRIASLKFWTIWVITVSWFNALFYEFKHIKFKYSCYGEKMIFNLQIANSMPSVLCIITMKKIFFIVSMQNQIQLQYSLIHKMGTNRLWIMIQLLTKLTCVLQDFLSILIKARKYLAINKEMVQKIEIGTQNGKK